ncbi:hypothetical protein [Nonomuraea gerenzanensis]|uniref:Basic proline-rich protein n=1 Tax=Nonomuraea gerenzanensis TaxID=93944 RepID=A0A1M4BKX1_9ACTN|nr:hypothetical protein [Nonomuraea gerenzanensis]UBU10069.1 hypothetical protein LCN96_37710 [Nonomuraea gerenzanensis]SAP16307.1 Basic proline-rich protein precursor [Nonomuraea gerenzanensis]
MSRHRRRRRRQLPPHIERNVANADAPAVARRRDDGVIVVDVDETLHGAARDDAIAAALEPFEQGRLALLPWIALLWDAAARRVNDYPRTAAAVAGAGTVAVLGTAALTVTGTLEEERRPVVAAKITRVVTVTPAVPASSGPSWSDTPAPSRTTVTSPAATPPPSRAQSAGDGDPERPPRAIDREREEPEPSASSSTRRPAPHTSAATARPRTSQPEAQAAQEPEPRRSQEARPAPARSSQPPPTVDEPDQPAPEPQPEPAPEPEPTRGPVVDVEVGGDDCRLVDLDVGVGDLLGAGVCL